MAVRVNSFALLDDDESDDVSGILSRVASKHVASSQPFATEKKLINQKGQKEKTEKSSAQPQFSSKPLPRSDQFELKGKGKGEGEGEGEEEGGNYSGRYIESQQSQNNQNHSRENSRQRVDGHSNDYRQGNRQAHGVQQYNNQRANGYNQENRWSNGDVPEQKQADHGNEQTVPEKKQADDGNEQADTDGFQVYYSRKKSRGGSQQGHGVQGGGRGGRGRGRGFYSLRHDNQGLVNKQVNGDGQNGVSGGSSQEQVKEENLSKYEGDSRRPNGERGNNGNYRGSGNQEAPTFARRGRMSNGKSAEVKTSETKKQDVEGDAKDNMNVTAFAERNGSLASEASRDADSKQEKQSVASRDHSRNGGEKDKNENKMTLEEYEKQLLEKRKGLEALKTEERKVLLDKDFEAMKLVGKKKENVISIKPMKDSLIKDEKVLEATSILQKAWWPEYYKRRGGRNQHDDTEDGDGLSTGLAKPDNDSPNFEDSRQFPSLPGSTGR